MTGEMRNSLINRTLAVVAQQAGMAMGSVHNGLVWKNRSMEHSKVRQLPDILLFAMWLCSIELWIFNLRCNAVDAIPADALFCISTPLQNTAAEKCKLQRLLKDRIGM